MNPGIAYAAAAFTLWGLFPLYLQQVASVAALEVVAHRIFWSLLFVFALLAWRRQWAWIGELRGKPRTLGVFALSATLISVNWLTYVWAVNNGHVIDSSLGYFINPLVNVLLGYFVLGERPRRLQWAAIALAAVGVAWLTWHAGRPPWIALVLAASFGLYGLIRKTAPLGALEGLTLETMLLSPLALAALVWWTWQGSGGLAQPSAAALGWLLLAGPLTAIPLLLFAAGARRISLATLGLMQYIGPSLQFMLAVWWFKEPMQAERFVGFVVIWTALALYSLEGWWRSGAPSSNAASLDVQPKRTA